MFSMDTSFWAIFFMIFWFTTMSCWEDNLGVPSLISTASFGDLICVQSLSHKALASTCIMSIWTSTVFALLRKLIAFWFPRTHSAFESTWLCYCGFFDERKSNVHHQGLFPTNSSDAPIFAAGPGNLTLFTQQTVQRSALCLIHWRTKGSFVLEILSNMNRLP